jgi:tetratricopeptide (TPR) repeat protein
MRKKFSKRIPAVRRVGKAKKLPIKSADSFFNGPAGVILICLLFFGLTAWAFAPALKTNFQIFDESGELFLNTHMNSGLGWHNLRWALFSLEYSNWYPLTWISHMIDFKMSGANSWGHHLTSVLLHAANGVLLFLVLNKMTGALWRSLIVAALFALHPLRVESVAWISERKDVLCVFFGLLAMWTYAHFAEASRTPGGRPKLFYGLTLLFFAFGLMSKSMLVTFPCLLLLLDFWPLERWRRKDKWRLLLEKVPFFLLIVPVGIVVYFAQKAGGQFLLRFPLDFRLETALMGYARYLGKMFWPTNLSVLYPYPDHWSASELLLAAAMILGASIAAFILRRQWPYLLTGWFWFLGSLVPVIGLIPLGAQSMSNRYTYLPMIGILLLAVWAVADLSKHWQRRTVLMTTVAVLVLGVCVSRTRGEIVYWKNSETLWSRAVAVTGKNFMAHYCLGLILTHSSIDKALAEYQKSVDAYPDYSDSQRELGLQMSNSGLYSNSIAHFEKAMQLDPQNSWTYHGLGIALDRMGRSTDAVPLLLKAVEVDPQNGDYKDDLGRFLFPNGQPAGVGSNFLATVRSDPAGFGRFLDVEQVDTNHFTLLNNMAWIFATNPDPQLRNGKYAVRLATRACEMTGYKINNCVFTLAVAYAEDSRFDDAISLVQRARSQTTVAGQPELLKQYQMLLDLFRSHQPYHEAIK